MNDIFVRLVSMPAAVKGQVRVTPDGDYLIFINSMYNRAQQEEIYRHEMTHIIRSHHWQTQRAVADVEAETLTLPANIADILRAEAAGMPLSPVPGVSIDGAGAKPAPSNVPRGHAPPVPGVSIDSAGAKPKHAPSTAARANAPPPSQPDILAELAAWFEEWESENERRIDRADRHRDNQLGLEQNGL